MPQKFPAISLPPGGTASFDQKRVIAGASITIDHSAGTVFQGLRRDNSQGPIICGAYEGNCGTGDGVTANFYPCSFPLEAGELIVNIGLSAIVQFE